MVHVLRPSGGVEQARAIKWASARPSKMGCVGGVDRFFVRVLERVWRTRFCFLPIVRFFSVVFRNVTEK